MLVATGLTDALRLLWMFRRLCFCLLVSLALSTAGGGGAVLGEMVGMVVCGVTGARVGGGGLVVTGGEFVASGSGANV